MHTIFLTLALLGISTANSQIPKSCPQTSFARIPDNHLYHRKSKPVYIAHRGQPRAFLENTLEGIKSTVELKADGYELDIFLTKDDQLVVFHYENTLILSGVSKNVSDCTYDELLQLNLTANVTRGGKEYRFKGTSKIPLLKEVLKEMKNTDLLHVLEMKPEYVDKGDNAQSAKIGKKLAELVTEMQLVERSILISFDYRKIHAAKLENPNLVVGNLFMGEFSTIPKSSWKLDMFPELTQCFFDAPNETLEFYKFLVESGVLSNATGASLFLAGLNVYEERQIPNNTLAMLKKNYRKDVNSGFYTAYSMYNTEEQNLVQQPKYKSLVYQGAEVLITDDVGRLREFLISTSSATKQYTAFSSLIAFLAFAWIEIDTI